MRRQVGLHDSEQDQINAVRIIRDPGAIVLFIDGAYTQAETGTAEKGAYAVVATQLPLPLPPQPTHMDDDTYIATCLKTITEDAHLSHTSTRISTRADDEAYREDITVLSPEICEFAAFVEALEQIQNKWLNRPVIICYDATALKKCITPTAKDTEHNDALHIRARHLYRSIEEMRHAQAKRDGRPTPIRITLKHTHAHGQGTMEYSGNTAADALAKAAANRAGTRETVTFRNARQETTPITQT